MRGPGCEYAVEVRDLAVGYGAKTILHDVSFRVRRGEIVAILGGSGCGKSTLLKAVIGLLPVKEGEILIEGESMVSSTPAERRKIQRKFGVAFQGGRCSAPTRSERTLRCRWRSIRTFPARRFIGGCARNCIWSIWTGSRI